MGSQNLTLLILNEYLENKHRFLGGKTDQNVSSLPSHFLNFFLLEFLFEIPTLHLGQVYPQFENQRPGVESFQYS